MVANPRLVMAALAAVTAGCADGPQRLRDASATSTLSQLWNERREEIVLGDVHFVQATSYRRQVADSAGSLVPVRIPVAAIQRYRAFAAGGLISIQNERGLFLSGEYQRDSAGVDRYVPGTSQLVAEGVRRTATIVATPSGLQKATIDSSAGSPRRLSFVVGHYVVERIVSNEPVVEENAEKYRLVMGTHRFEIDPSYSEVLEQAGASVDRELRFRVLFKFDPFTSRWQFVVADVGPREREFETSIVLETLAGLGRRGAP